MSQRKSGEEELQARLFGRELRRRRGNSSQEEFSRRVGVTRSALANCELGRSLPKAEVIDRIALSLGVSREELIPEPSLEDIQSKLQRLIATDGQPTKDEWAIVRTLRLSSPDVVKAVVQTITGGLEAAPPRLAVADPETVTIDVARLYSIASRGGEYDRGLSVGDVTGIAKALAARVRSER